MQGPRRYFSRELYSNLALSKRTQVYTTNISLTLLLPKSPLIVPVTAVVLLPLALALALVVDIEISIAHIHDLPVVDRGFGLITEVVPEV